MTTKSILGIVGGVIAISFVLYFVGYFAFPFD